jgi:hypothetical protein
MTSNRYLPRRARVWAEITAALLLALLLLPGGLFAGEANWSRDDAAHLLRRAGFGGTPVEIDRLFALGREGAVDYLVTGKLPAGIEAPFAHVELPGFTSEKVNYRVLGAGVLYEVEKARAWTLDHMVRSDRPLDEKMTLFWHGLFTSGLREVKNPTWLVEQDALLRHEAIGNYKRLTHAIIHDSAMLKYLNNDDNVKGHPNENLARELMELFTMGEGNGYTEADIPEVARALTGQTVRFSSAKAQFVDSRHDDGPKTIFGKTGNYMPDDVVDLIFDRPEPAAYLAKRLWTFFGTSDPSEQEIEKTADALRKNNWDLAPALRVLFTSPEFYSDKAKFTRIKSPVELEAMTIRLLEEPAHPRILSAAAFMLRMTGEELFQPPNVKGWPGGEHWITSSAIFLRYNLAAAMASGMMGANIGRGRGFAGGQPPLPARSAINPARLRAGAATQPATQPSDAAREARITAAAAAREAAAKDPRFARIMALREEQAKKVQEEIAKIPPLPPVDELVKPARLFAQLGKEPKAAELVDAAVNRFLQRPLADEKKATLTQSLGSEPLKLGEPATDRRVRQMIGALLSTPEYQVE